MELDSELRRYVVSDDLLGVLVSVLRIFTKAVYPQDASSLQKSVNLYFVVSIVVLFICMVFYNIVHKLPVMKYYNGLKVEAVPVNEPMTGTVWRSNVWNIVGSVKWYGFGIVLIYVVTLAIFTGYITKEALKFHYDTYFAGGSSKVFNVNACESSSSRT